MSDDFLTMMLQSLAALAAVLALFAVLVWFVRRLQTHRFQDQASNLHILQRIPLDAKHHLVEVAQGNHRYLIGLSPDGITTIARKTLTAELSPPEESEEA